MDTKTAHIIFNNDSPEAVVLDDYDRAETIRAEMEEAYTQHTKNMNPKPPAYWHIHTVDVKK